MPEVPLLRLGPGVAIKERRLAALLQGRDPGDSVLLDAVRDAQVLGSLELAGLTPTPGEVAEARRGDPASAPVLGLYGALKSVDPGAPFAVAHLLTWHAALCDGGLRTGELEREGGPPPAPAVFIAARLASLEEWLNVESGRELKPAERGALALARVMEILPFDRGNGRVARLAASHVMVRAGARSPLLRGADAPRLEQALNAAYRLETGPLVALLEESSERALDVSIGALAAGPVA